MMIMTMMMMILSQVRLDFETFELAPPSLTHFPIGECDLDR